MRLFVFPAVLVTVCSLTLVSMSACGGDEATKEDPGTLAPASAESSDDPPVTEQPSTPTLDEQKTAWCTTICQKQLSCAATLSCTGLSDQASCVNQCKTQNVTQEAADQTAAASCDQINGAFCMQAQFQQNCQCPDLGTCPATQSCVGVSSSAGGTINLCIAQNGGPPAAAPTCSATTACPNAQTQTCVTFTDQAGASMGSYCLEACGA